ncbi:MAG: penicillin-binding protein, partial [Bordetella sp.]
TGAGAHGVLKRNDVAGKSGTTNGTKELWFSGFVPSLETTVWMGFDQPGPLGAYEFGSGTALSTWLAYMQPMLANVPQTPPPPMPQGLIQADGDYYFSEYPPGQNVASLDLGVNQATNPDGTPVTNDSDVLGGFLNKMWSNISKGPSANRIETPPVPH